MTLKCRFVSWSIDLTWASLSRRFLTKAQCFTVWNVAVLYSWSCLTTEADRYLNDNFSTVLPTQWKQWKSGHTGEGDRMEFYTAETKQSHQHVFQNSPSIKPQVLLKESSTAQFWCFPTSIKLTWASIALFYCSALKSLMWCVIVCLMWTGFMSLPAFSQRWRLNFR